jgi:hypothetical protein
LISTVFRYCLGLRVARVARESEDHDAQADAYLRCGQPRAVERAHGVEHVPEQFIELCRAEGLDGRRRLQQPRVSHPQHIANGHPGMIA